MSEKNQSWISKNPIPSSIILLTLSALSALYFKEGSQYLPPILALGGILILVADVLRNKKLNLSGSVNLENNLSGQIGADVNLKAREPRKKHVGSTSNPPMGYTSGSGEFHVICNDNHGSETDSIYNVSIASTTFNGNLPVELQNALLNNPPSFTSPLPTGINITFWTLPSGLVDQVDF